MSCQVPQRQATKRRSFRLTRTSHVMCVEDEEEDACPVTMWFAWHMHTHQEEEEEGREIEQTEEEIEQTPEEALFEAAEEV